MLILWIVLGFLAAAALALVLAPAYIRLVDRAPWNDRSALTFDYERPRYFVRDGHGVKTDARWPGWDAWNVCALPNDPAQPPQMIRGSLMTGLYGLEGVDNYERLIERLSGDDAIEHLCLIPTVSQLPNGQTVVLNNLAQYYLPKRPDLVMSDAKLDVKIIGSRVADEVTNVPYSHIYGVWPNYQIFLLNPESEIEVEMLYRGRRILWWLDIPGRHTHFATFGTFQVTIRYMRGVNVTDIHRPLERPEQLRFEAHGALEHVFAARAAGFRHVWRRVLGIGNWIPGFKPVTYHNEVLFGDGIEGGFLYARAFGVQFKNSGGLFVGDAYHPVKRVQVRYSDADLVDNCGGIGEPTRVWSRWQVDAETDAGPLSYTAERTHPPAMISANDNQYHFRFQGTWAGRPIAGRGYGEYIHF